MAYLRARGGLQEAAKGYLEQMRRALETPGGAGRVVVAAQVEDETRHKMARRWVFMGGPAGPATEVAADMGRTPALAEFVGWVREEAPAERYALLILAHGVSPAPEDQETQNAAGRLEIRTVAAALGVGQPRPIELVSLDCCYSGSVEVADRLVGRARYMVAAPGLLYSPGLPWGAILGQLLRRPEIGGRDLALEASRQARMFWGERREVPSSLVAVDLGRLPALTQALRSLAQTALPRVEGLAPELTLARGEAAGWGPRRELVAVTSLAQALAETTTVPEVADLAKQVSVAAQNATVEAWRQEPDDSEQTGSGLGIFYPLDIRSWAQGYGAEPDGGFTADWALLLRAYLQRMAFLARGGR